MAVNLIIFAIILTYNLGVFANENRVAGPPKVQCGTEMISVSIPTKKPFLGRIFVKGMSKDPSCGRHFDNNTDSMASVRIKFGSCGMSRERKLSPAPGLEESMTLIVSFHYLFVTKTDRAYNIQCFYGQHNLATVTFGYNVSLMPTEMVQYGQKRTQMPACIYEVRKGSLNGSLVQFATVGDELWHKWTCGVNESSDGKILVKNCYVAEGNGDRFLVIDARGCAIDPQVISDLQYDSNATMAWVRTYAFKFADTPAIAFSCTIQICMPDEIENCDEITPPRCAMTSPNEILINQTRRLADTPAFLHDEIDVSSPVFNVLDAGLHVDVQRGPLTTLEKIDNLTIHHQKFWPLDTDDRMDQICIDRMNFALITVVSMALVIILICVSVILFITMLRYRRTYRWKPTSPGAFNMLR